MGVFFASTALPLARRWRLIDAMELRLAATSALWYRAVTLDLFPYTGLTVKGHHTRRGGIKGAIDRVQGRGPCWYGSKWDKTGDNRVVRGILHWGIPLL